MTNVFVFQVVKELVAIFPVLRDWIAEFLSENKCMIASDIGHNMLIEQVYMCDSFRHWTQHVNRTGIHVIASDIGHNMLIEQVYMCDSFRHRRQHVNRTGILV